VAKAGQRQFGRAQAAAQLVFAFEQQHRQAGLLQRNGGG
jgi:hypothetical protein